ncbi:MAG: hypothetical protein OXD45_03080 [Rhodobacteraceae bacterium]|nr:hypothetical protein [Paracoccaceae bacterium]
MFGAVLIQADNTFSPHLRRTIFNPHQKTIARIGGGKDKANSHTVDSLAKALDVSHAYLGQAVQGTRAKAAPSWIPDKNGTFQGKHIGCLADD